MSGVPLAAFVRLLDEAHRQRPGIYVGEVEPGPKMRLYDARKGYKMVEVGHLDFARDEVVWASDAAVDEEPDLQERADPVE